MGRVGRCGVSSGPFGSILLGSTGDVVWSLSGHLSPLYRDRIICGNSHGKDCVVSVKSFVLVRASVSVKSQVRQCVYLGHQLNTDREAQATDHQREAFANGALMGTNGHTDQRISIIA